MADYPKHKYLRELLSALNHPGHSGQVFDGKPIHVNNNDFYSLPSKFYPETPESLQRTYELLDAITLDLLHISPCDYPNCACQIRHCVLHAFSHGVDDRVLQYVLDHDLLPPAFLCDALGKMFDICGGMYDNPQLYLNRRVAAIRAQPLNSKQRSKAIKQAIHDGLNCDPHHYSFPSTDTNINMLLPWLCTRHPGVVRNWRATKKFSHDGNTDVATMMHYVLYGFASDESRLKWINQLLAIGCDPFAHHCRTMLNTPWHSMADKLMLDLVVRLTRTRSAEEIATHVNYVDPDDYNYSRDCLMNFMLRRQSSRYPDDADAIFGIIALYARYTDMSRVDFHGCGHGDYLSGGLRKFLEEMLARYIDKYHGVEHASMASAHNLETKDEEIKEIITREFNANVHAVRMLLATPLTGNTVYRIRQSDDEATTNPSLLASLMQFTKNQMAPSDVETFLREWRRIAPSKLSVIDWLRTAEVFSVATQYNTGYPSLSSVASDTGWKWVLLYHKLVPDWREEREWHEQKRQYCIRGYMLNRITHRYPNGPTAIDLYLLFSAQDLTEYENDERFAPYMRELKRLRADVAAALAYRKPPKRYRRHKHGRHGRRKHE